MRRILCVLMLCLAAASVRAGTPPTRLVSLAPSLTEVLYALGLDDRIVGVTDWCRYPPAARDKPSMGGHVDPNLEAVLRARPELVLVEEANAAVRGRLDALGLPVLVVDHRDVAGILASLSAVGTACGVPERAESLRAALEARIAAVRERVAERQRPRALVVVGRTLEGGELRDLYLAGADTFLGELLSLAGGGNVAPSGLGSYPVLSLEGLLRVGPEVVFDLAPEVAHDGDDLEALTSAWRRLDDLSAVRRGAVFVLTDDALLIPGPRFVDTLELFAARLDPAWTPAAR